MSGSEPVDDPCRVIVADEEYRELKEIIIIDEGAERIVWGARRSRKGVVLQGGYDDMDELVGYVAAAANHAKNRRQERILDRVFEAMSDAVGTSI